MVLAIVTEVSQITITPPTIKAKTAVVQIPHATTTKTQLCPLLFLQLLYSENILLIIVSLITIKKTLMQHQWKPITTQITTKTMKKSN